MTTITIDQSKSVNLYVDKQGQGQPLVFIHGWAASHRFWKYQIPYFAENHQVIAYDLRGHGDSEQPERGYQVSAHVDDLKILLAKYQIASPVLIGHSLGGMIALQFALDQSTIPRALVLVGTSSHPVDSLKRSIQFSFLRFIIRLSRNRAAKFTEKELFGPDVDPQLVEWVNAESLRTPTHVILEILQDVKKFNLTARLSDLNIPVLIINGEFDSATTPNSATQMQQLLPQAQIQVVNGAGHNCMLEKPLAFNSILISFLGELRNR
ncbi:MAG: alpha/beta fold hydrolase [Promethearchaeota archaeon]